MEASCICVETIPIPSTHPSIHCRLPYLGMNEATLDHAFCYSGLPTGRTGRHLILAPLMYQMKSIKARECFRFGATPDSTRSCFGGKRAAVSGFCRRVSVMGYIPCRLRGGLVKRNQFDCMCFGYGRLLVVAVEREVMKAMVRLMPRL